MMSARLMSTFLSRRRWAVMVRHDMTVAGKPGNEAAVRQKQLSLRREARRYIL